MRLKNRYDALKMLREIYESPLLDLALKVKLKDIIRILESTL